MCTSVWSWKKQFTFKRRIEKSEQAEGGGEEEGRRLVRNLPLKYWPQTKRRPGTRPELKKGRKKKKKSLTQGRRREPDGTRKWTQRKGGGKKRSRAV